MHAQIVKYDSFIHPFRMMLFHLLNHSIAYQSLGRTTYCSSPHTSVIAFERVPSRAKILRETIAKAGAKDLVHIVESDFCDIDVTSEPWSNATLALCDPSCSGSGNTYYKNQSTATNRSRGSGHEAEVVKNGMPCRGFFDEMDLKVVQQIRTLADHQVFMYLYIYIY
jgi:16S rRNA C967 or C1407 C5-methylase (RsmB/RsmF family)